MRGDDGVIRILKTLNFQMPGTVRIGLCTGEEQGVLGSKAYVTEHFGNPEDMKLKPEHAKLSGYFNLDTGIGGGASRSGRGTEIKKHRSPQIWHK